MAGRTIAVGDIHGCADALATVIAAVRPVPADTLVFLGDYIDRGPDSRRVVEQLIALARRCRVVPLCGNHEETLREAIRDKANLKRWLTNGGVQTLESYGWTRGGGRRPLAEWFPAPHRELLLACKDYHETATHLFVHAGYVPELPLDRQPREALLWRVTDPRVAIPHCSGKRAVVGHTVQWSGEILDLGCLVCIDTNCVRGGWLTALDVGTGQTWQADSSGRLRNGGESASARTDRT